MMRTMGYASETESLDDLSFPEQLESFRGFTESILGGQEAISIGDSLEMQLNHRYGEGTADNIRKMIDVFIEKKTK